MEGGNPGTLVVPEKCYLFVDRYVVPGETDEICIAQIMEAAEQLGLSGKVDVRLKPRKSPYMQSFAVEMDPVHIFPINRDKENAVISRLFSMFSINLVQAKSSKNKGF